ncbi:MAG: stealth conserved region 3 domain-containing protein, partial [Jatrophihabitans sp.]
RVAKFLLAPDTAIDLSPRSARDVPAVAAAKNMRALIEAEFGVTIRRKIEHGVHPQQRSVVVELESRFPQVFDQVARSRFRHPDDLSIVSSLQHFFAFVSGRAVPGDWGFRYQDISRPDTARRLDQILRERPQSFCLNDMDSTEEHLDGQHAALTQFFGEYFPLPAPWERRPTTS